MKQIFKIGEMQTFETNVLCTAIPFIKKWEEAWVIKRPHYFYTETVEQAKEQYIKLYGYSGINVYSNMCEWLDWSSNTEINYLALPKNLNKVVRNVKNTIVELKTDNTTCEDLYKDLNAQDYTDWFFKNMNIAKENKNV